MAPRKKSPKASAPKVNDHLKGIIPYPPGKPIEEVQREFGLDSVIKMASNENPLGPSPKAIKAMQTTASEMHLYPDGAGFYLKQALATKLGVPTEQIVLGNGTDELLMLLAMAYLGPKKGLVTSDYSFVRYRMAGEQVGAPVTLVPMKRMTHDLAAMAKAIKRNTGMVCLDLPGNPTGCTVTRNQLVRFIKQVPANVMIVLDQAYIEFTQGDKDFPDGMELRDLHPNLVVTRTFSKAYGLAGLRIGYAVARPEIIDGIERVRPPFNANRMAQAAALAALEDKAFLRRAVSVNAKGRKQLEKGFAALGLKSYPSLANFVLVDVGRDAAEVFGALLRLGVITRPMKGMGLTTCVRISVGTPEENTRCLAALTQVLGA